MDLDLLDGTNNELTLVGQDYVTLRVAEQATTTGYAWEDPEVYPCLELQSSNHGDFVTGYK